MIFILYCFFLVRRIFNKSKYKVCNQIANRISKIENQNNIIPEVVDRFINSP